MNVFKRIVAGLAILLSGVGLLLSLAGGIGVWIVKEPVTVRATRIFGRIEGALDIADQGLEKVKASLGRASERLDSVKEAQRQLAQEPAKTNAVQRLLARSVQQRIAPEIGNANETLHTVAEAAVVVNSVLEDVGNLPFLSVSGLDVSHLSEINGRLSEVASSAWELGRLLGDPGAESGADSASVQVSRIEQAIQAMRRLIAEYEPRLTQVRQQAAELKARLLFWITPALVFISSVCLWIALSQVCLLSRAWSWWRGLAHPETGRP